MDEIEAGFQKLTERIGQNEKERELLGEEVKKKEENLFGRMTALATPLVPSIGITMLRRGKQDTKGELYDTVFHKNRMIVLGKADPAGRRPDDASKEITDLFCVLSEDGKLYEMMFSFDGFIIESFPNPITTKEILDRYGYDPIYMLYHALHDYLKGQENLVAALKMVLDFIVQGPSIDKKN